MVAYNIGCYKILEDIINIPYTEEEINIMIGKRWEQIDIVRILKQKFNAIEIDNSLEKNDILLNGKHVGIYDGKNKMLHYLKGRKMATNINNIKIDKILRIKCQQR
jgi:hypothetical protein